MNLLLVDDQKEILKSLREGIAWETLPVERIYTATSAMEAKLVMMNFPVDVLLTDIEMPEENGLSLAAWARENVTDLEIVFLTSHPDFSYAQEALRLGSFDYILQPVRYTDVEAVLRRVQGQLEKRRSIRRLERTRDLMAEQRGTILDAMLSKTLAGKTEDANLIFAHFAQILEEECGGCRVMPLLIQIQRWKKITDTWDENLVRMALANVLGELFETYKVQAFVSIVRENRYWCFLVYPGELPQEEIFWQKLEEFYGFIHHHMDFSVSVYCGGVFAGLPQEERDGETDGVPLWGECLTPDLVAVIEGLRELADTNTEKRTGVFREVTGKAETSEEEDCVATAIEYVKRNIGKNILRSEVAEQVHLNEEYFSRLFKAKTGVTFKDYVLIEKMNTAKKLLATTKLSVGIVASKVGFDNFSHFSKMFKKITDQTPQEYRKQAE
ncbi:MAG: helix-turn-helix domain-containing protein [Eubacteriales bacterium]|nr:helix-turn-helix domain-containing protein [Eubacteriales bacterium]